MTLIAECWWDSAPELMTPDLLERGPPGALGPFRGVTTNPMLLLEACRRAVPENLRRRRMCSGWDLYLACGARSAGFLASRQISVPFCVQLDPRAAFNTDSMLRQAAEIRQRIPSATIKVPMTMAGIEAIKLLAPTGATINATWGFSVAQLVTAAQAMADGHSTQVASRPRHVLTLMEGRIGDLGLSTHLGQDETGVRAAECVVFEAAYDALRLYEDVATLLASSLRPGPGDQCWHLATKVGRKVIVTLPPSFLRRQGLPRLGLDYGGVDGASLARAIGDDMTRRCAAADGFEPYEFDHLPPLVKTHEEATRAMEGFEYLACHG
jgi:transaldolase